MAELLVLPAVLGYGEAAVVYAGELRGSHTWGRYGIWGVRVGWLAQTGLLIAQALSSEGFPWTTWAGALNLFVWLVVSGYLVWGCRPGYRLVGLALMPVAVALLVLAWAGGGTGVVATDDEGAVLAVHAGLMLAAFAGVTVAAAMAALFLWEERRLKRRDTAVLRIALPPLVVLDRLAGRVALVSLGLLTAGIVAGLARFERGDFDAAMAVALLTWGVEGAALFGRWSGRLSGRRFAWCQLLVFALVGVVLPLTHFAS